MKELIERDWQGWKVIRRIGTGGFGAVYEIQRDIFGKTEHAALKVISIPQNPEEIEEFYSEGYDQDTVKQHYTACLENFVREYSIMLDMKGHGNIVYCDDLRYSKQEDGIGWHIYIKMELLTPLLKVISAEYDEKQVIAVGKDICNALVACKMKNIVHRDIKPQNLFVSFNGTYKLGDFGIAKISEKTQSGTKIGTPDYMSPEVFLNKPYGATADIYSLGLVLYWLMNEHKLPFLPQGKAVPMYDDKAKARERILSGEPLPEPVHGSDKLKKIVLKACAFTPADRYQSAQEMLDALSIAALDLHQPVIEPEQSQEAVPDPEPEEKIAETVAVRKPEKKKEQVIEVNIPQQPENSPTPVPEPKVNNKGVKIVLTVALLLVLVAIGVVVALNYTSNDDNNSAVNSTSYVAKTHTTHTYGSWKTITAARCVSSGEMQRTCTICGHKESKTIAKTGHTYGSWTIVTEATCRDNGTKIRTCSYCGHQGTETIVATGEHNNSNGSCSYCGLRLEVYGSNIAPGASYTTSQLWRQGGADVLWGWDDNAAVAYPDEEGVTLTDGLFATGDYTDTAWIGFHMNCPDHIQNGYSSITFDLGSVKSVNGVKTYVGTTTIGSGICIPSNLTVLVSKDGINYTEVANVVPDDDFSKMDTVVETAFAATDARYVQIRIVANGFAYVSEVEIYS